MTREKEQHPNQTVQNASKRFKNFSDAQLAEAVRISHIGTPVECIVDLLDNVLTRIHHHPEIDNMVKDEFFNDLRSFRFYKNLISE
jgi:uncharacterized short protein YbdD (DUF466 family)